MVLTEIRHQTYLVGFSQIYVMNLISDIEFLEVGARYIFRSE